MPAPGINKRLPANPNVPARGAAAPICAGRHDTIIPHHLIALSEALAEAPQNHLREPSRILSDALSQVLSEAMQC